MKKTMPDFLTYLTTLSVSLSATAFGGVAPVEAAAPQPERVPEAELTMSPAASEKLTTFADRTLNTSEGLTLSNPWWLFSRSSPSPTPAPSSLKLASSDSSASSFMDAFNRVKSNS